MWCAAPLRLSADEQPSPSLPGLGTLRVGGWVVRSSCSAIPSICTHRSALKSVLPAYGDAALCCALLPPLQTEAELSLLSADSLAQQRHHQGAAAATAAAGALGAPPRIPEDSNGYPPSASSAYYGGGEAGAGQRLGRTLQPGGGIARCVFFYVSMGGAWTCIEDSGARA